jgi:hypothetical protein
MKKASLLTKIILTTAFTLFFGIVLYSIYLNNFDSSFSINLISVYFLALSSVIRNYYVELLIRLKNNDQTFDFWLFYLDKIKSLTRTVDVKNYFLIIPFLRKQSNSELERARKKINYYTLICYATILAIILTINQV